MAHRCESHVGDIHGNTAAAELYRHLLSERKVDIERGIGQDDRGWRSSRELALALDSVCIHTRVWEVREQLGPKHGVCYREGCRCHAHAIESKQIRLKTRNGRWTLRAYYRIVPVKGGD